MKFDLEDMLMPGFFVVIIIFTLLGVIGTVFNNTEEVKERKKEEEFIEKSRIINFDSIYDLFAKK